MGFRLQICDPRKHGIPLNSQPVYVYFNRICPLSQNSGEQYVFVGIGIPYVYGASGA